MCPFCSVSVQNEVHFVFCCPGLDDLRSRYIHPTYFNFLSDFRLTLLLSTKNERTLRNLALYLCKAFNRRKMTMFWSILNIKMFMKDLPSLCCYLFVFCIIMVFDFKHVCAVWCLRNVQTYLLMSKSPLNGGYCLNELNISFVRSLSLGFSLFCCFNTDAKHSWHVSVLFVWYNTN